MGGDCGGGMGVCMGEEECSGAAHPVGWAGGDVRQMCEVGVA